MNDKRLYLAVAACAVVVHLGALWNQFALDDVTIVVVNPLIHSLAGVWGAFVAPYWPANLGGLVYRPLPIATYALDWQLHSPAWFHAVNLLWHAGVAVSVAALARRWTSATAALAAGLIFAVHPVHVEVVASVVGRADLMATLATCLAVYAALALDSVAWSAAFLVLGILSKESAAAAPALIALGWVLGLGRDGVRPAQRRVVAYAASWCAIGVAYLLLRWAVLHPYEGFPNLAPQFAGQGPIAIRMTAVAGFVDVARLLLFPLHLQADYSPLERVAVTTPLASGFLLGLLCLGAWVALFVLAWRNGRRVEAFGLGWIAIAYLPVANLVVPHGVVVAERLLYLPSVGLAIAAGALLERLPRRRAWAVAVVVLIAAGAVRSALRVPVWRDNRAAALAMIADAPLSYRSWDYLGWEYVWARRDERALTSFRRAGSLYPGDARLHLAAAHMAYTLGRTALADSLLARADSVCPRCPTAFRNQASAAQLRGDTAAARFLRSHVQRSPYLGVP